MSSLDERAFPAQHTAMTPEQFYLVRKLAGMSQTKTAETLGIARRVVQRIEAGTYGDPIPEKYRRLILTLKGK